MTNEKMIEERTKLEAELEKGKQALTALQVQQSATIATMQRIQGALQFIADQIVESPVKKNSDPTPEKKNESK